jgi:UV DNA damage endonuclease
MLRLERAEALARLSALCLANAKALLSGLEYCAVHGIGGFRVNSQILPLRTHPRAGYRVAELHASRQIVAAFRKCGQYARSHGLRLTFHPDQFVLLSSPRPDVTRSSVAELRYQAEVAEWVNADVINIHGGGAYGDKPAALARLSKALARLPERVRRRLTLENDDRVYTPRDLLPLCRAEGVPLVYDVHHHRCLPDGYSVAQATDLALATWNREPLFHVSSPKDGWRKPDPRRHHDYINPRDFPREWMDKELTVEVEAKAKELAVMRLARFLRKHGATVAPGSA